MIYIQPNTLGIITRLLLLAMLRMMSRSVRPFSHRNQKRNQVL